MQSAPWVRAFRTTSSLLRSLAFEIGRVSPTHAERQVHRRRAFRHAAGYAHVGDSVEEGAPDFGAVRAGGEYCLAAVRVAHSLVKHADVQNIGTPKSWKIRNLSSTQILTCVRGIPASHHWSAHSARQTPVLTARVAPRIGGVWGGARCTRVPRPASSPPRSAPCCPCEGYEYLLDCFLHPPKVALARASLQPAPLGLWQRRQLQCFPRRPRRIRRRRRRCCCLPEWAKNGYLKWLIMGRETTPAGSRPRRRRRPRRARSRRSTRVTPPTRRRPAQRRAAGEPTAAGGG